MAGWVTEQRTRLLAALLTLARAWYSAGCPRWEGAAIGSFETWCQTIGGILSHAGVSGFLKNLDGLHDEVDEEGPQWEYFLQSWFAYYQDEEITVAKLANDLSRSEPLRAALPMLLAEHRTHDLAFRQNLGKALARQKDAQYGRWRLESAGRASHQKVQKWRVVEVDTKEVKPAA